MSRLLPWLLVLSGLTISQAQAQTGARTEPKVYDRVEQMPAYPGGLDSLMRFFRVNIRYPEVALSDGAEGKVFVQFVVNAQGTPQKFEVLKSVHPALDAEALRVLKLMRRWQPGRKASKPVSVYYVLPLTFTIAAPAPSTAE